MDAFGQNHYLHITLSRIYWTQWEILYNFTFLECEHKFTWRSLLAMQVSTLDIVKPWIAKPVIWYNVGYKYTYK